MESQQQNLNGLVPDINKVDEYRKSEKEILYNNQKSDSLKGILESSQLSDLFLSDENMKNIQTQIRFGVYENSGKIISNQSPQEVSTVMRSIYLQNGSVPINSDDHLTNTISILNNDVIKYCVDHIINKLSLNDKYIKDISTLPVPMERPTFEKTDKTYDISNIY